MYRKIFFSTLLAALDTHYYIMRDCHSLHKTTQSAIASNVTDIDYLVGKLFVVSSADLATCMYTLKSNSHVREILTRYNPVAAQLFSQETG